MSELPDGIKDPSDLNRADGRLPDKSIENRMEILFLPKDYARGKRDLGVSDFLFCEAFEAAARGECVMLGFP